MKKNLLNVTMLFLLSFMLKAQSGTILNFDGDNDIVTTGTGISNYFAGKTAVTVEAMVRPETINGISGTGLGIIAGNYDYPTASSSMQFLLRRDNNNYAFWLQLAGSAYVNVTAQASVELNEWQHVAGVWDGNTASIFINGELKASLEVVGGLKTVNNQFVIGSNARNEDFDGDIDEVRVWETARTGDEIRTNKFTELTGNESGLVAYYQLNNGKSGGNNTSKTTVVDKTGNGYDGTLVNFALNGSSSNWSSGSVVKSRYAIPSEDLTLGTGINLTNTQNQLDARILGKDNLLYVAQTRSSASIAVYETSMGVPVKINEATGTSGIGFTATSMKIVGDYLYMTSRAGDFGSFAIVDISTPTVPVILSEVATGPSYYLDVMGDTLVVAGAFGQVVNFYNISDKANSVLINSFRLTNVNQNVPAEFSNGVLFASLVDSITAFDITDPNNVTQIGSVDVISVGQVAIHENALYFNNGGDTISVFDISDPANIVFNTKIDVEKVVSYKVLGDRLYLSQFGAPAFATVYDVSDPLSPVFELQQNKNITLGSIGTESPYRFVDFAATDHGIYKIGMRNFTSSALAIFSYFDALTCPKACYNSQFTAASGQVFEDVVNDFTVTDTVNASNGLDSILTQMVMVSNPVDVAVAVSGNTITANNSLAQYQWINCEDNSVIADESKKSFTAGTSGDYAAIITEDGCKDTTVCSMIIVTSSNEIAAAELQVFPNPTSGKIHFRNSEGITETIVRNSLGEVVSTNVVDQTAGSHSLEINQAPGLYFVEVVSKTGETVIFKVQKN